MTVQQEENRSVKRKVKNYNLDMIISLGYRIKSKIVQNKLHFAAHGYIALEVIYKRADDKEPFIGLKTFKGKIPVLQEIQLQKII